MQKDVLLLKNFLCSLKKKNLVWWKDKGKKELMKFLNQNGATTGEVYWFPLQSVVERIYGISLDQAWCEADPDKYYDEVLANE